MKGSFDRSIRSTNHNDPPSINIYPVVNLLLYLIATISNVNIGIITTMITVSIDGINLSLIVLCSSKDP